MNTSYLIFKLGLSEAHAFGAVFKSDRMIKTVSTSDNCELGQRTGIAFSRVKRIEESTESDVTNLVASIIQKDSTATSKLAVSSGHAPRHGAGIFSWRNSQNSVLNSLGLRTERQLSAHQPTVETSQLRTQC